MILSRRGFIGGLAAALVTAPAIVSAGNLMPIRGVKLIVNPGTQFEVHGVDQYGQSVIEQINVETFTQTRFRTISSISFNGQNDTRYDRDIRMANANIQEFGLYDLKPMRSSAVSVKQYAQIYRLPQFTEAQ